MKPTPEMLEALGITREDVLNSTVKELAKQILGRDEDDGNFDYPGIETRVNREVQKYIDSKVAEVLLAECDKIFKPLIESKLSDYTFQQTNTWGEKTGDVLTFTEYLVKQIEGYMLDEVDSRGRTKEQCREDYDSFRPTGPRIAASIKGYFADTTKEAMDKVLKDSAEILTEGIGAATKKALGDIHSRLVAKVEVKG